MNPRIEELVLLALLACTCLVFAWAYDDMMFSAVFAAEAGFAGLPIAVIGGGRSRWGGGPGGGLAS
jgi:hypothetical protein